MITIQVTIKEQADGSIDYTTAPSREEEATVNELRVGALTVQVLAAAIGGAVITRKPVVAGNPGQN